MAKKTDPSKMAIVAAVMNLLAGTLFLVAGLTGQSQSRTTLIPLAAAFFGLGVFWFTRARKPAGEESPPAVP